MTSRSKHAVMIFGAFGLALVLSGCHYHHFRHHRHHGHGYGFDQGHYNHGGGHHGHHKKKHHDDD